jgi:1,3-beta-glucan synthase
LKQTKLRKRRVVRYAILYFVILVVFLALLVGPIVAGKQIDISSFAKSIPMEILQPTGYNNNDTSGGSPTGRCLQLHCPLFEGGDATGAGDSTGGATGAADATAAATTAAARRFARYMAY